MKAVTIAIIPIFITLLLLPACTTPEKFEVDTEARLEVFLTGLSFDYLANAKALNSQSFKYYNNEKNSLKSVETQLAAMFSSEKHKKTISGWYADINSVTDPYLKRQLLLVSNIFLVNSIEYSKEILDLKQKMLESFKNLKFVEKDKTQTLHQYLLGKQEADTGEALSDFNADLKQLISSRNDRARNLGFNSFAHLVLNAENTDIKELRDLMEKLDKATAQAFRNSFKDSFSEIYTALREPWQNSNEGMEILKNELVRIFDNLTLRHKNKIKFTFAESSLPSRGFSVNIPAKYSFVVTAPVTSARANYEFIQKHIEGSYYVNLRDPKILLSSYKGIIGGWSRIWLGAYKEILADLVFNYSKIKFIDPSFNDENYRLLYLRVLLTLTDYELSLYTTPNPQPVTILRASAEKYLFADPGDSIPPEWLLDIALVDRPMNHATTLMAKICANQILGSLYATLPPDKSDIREYGLWIHQFLIGKGELYTWRKKLRDITTKNIEVNEYLNWILVQ